MLSLGRFSNWSRGELRELTPEEFAAYVEEAAELAKEEKPQQ